MSWLRKAWPGPIVVKGVLTGEDAQRALDEGAAGVVVSNHGGGSWTASPPRCARCRKSWKPWVAGPKC